MTGLKWKLQDKCSDIFELEFEGHHYECCENDANDNFFTLVKDQSIKELWKIYPITDMIDRSLIVGLFEGLDEAALFIQDRKLWNDMKKKELAMFWVPPEPDYECRECEYIPESEEPKTEYVAPVYAEFTGDEMPF